MPQVAHELEAKQAIRDALSRYCRALDRMDKEMAYALWEPDATANYLGIYSGTGHGFVDWVWHAHQAMQCHSHQISNVLIEIDGDTAASEAYVTVVLWTSTAPDGGQQEIICRGRYLDRWVLRGDQWKIRDRTHVIDMHTVSEIARGPVSQESTRDRSDPSYLYLS